MAKVKKVSEAESLLQIKKFKVKTVKEAVEKADFDQNALEMLRDILADYEIMIENEALPTPTPSKKKKAAKKPTKNSSKKSVKKGSKKSGKK